jgi:hypothetical protein
MTKLDWRPLGGLARARLAEARLETHHAVQWLARTARAFIPAKPDDSHTNLGWDDALDGFSTHPLQDGARLGLRISDLTLVLLPVSGAGSSEQLRLHGRPNADARAWLGQHLRARGLDDGALDAPSPYEIPAHAIAKGAAYREVELKDALGELAAWFANAEISLGRIRERYAAKKLQVSPVRCWPHHFDLATLLSLDAGGGEQARTVNAGLSPGDESYNEPYFYVSPYPYPAAAKLPKLSKLGHWHTQGFTAAVAPASRIIAAENRQAESEAFLQEAVEGAMKVLG